jgi:hypothetical protein
MLDSTQSSEIDVANLASIGSFPHRSYNTVQKQPFFENFNQAGVSSENDDIPFSFGLKVKK